MTHDHPPLSRDFKGIWIPREIWLDKRLSIQAKMLLAEVHSLYDLTAEGCYASDEYLMEFLQLKKSQFYDVLKELTDRGLMIKVSFDGRRTVRRAVIPPESSSPRTGEQHSGKPESSTPENRKAPPGTKKRTPYIREKKDIEKSISTNVQSDAPLSSLSSPPKRKKVQEEWVDRAERVSTTPSQHESLLHKAKEDERLVEKWYVKLNDWKISKGKIGGRGDYQAILNWVIGAVETPAFSPSKEKKFVSKSKNSQEQNEKIAEKLEKKYQPNAYGSIECSRFGLKFYKYIGPDQCYSKEIDFSVPTHIFIEECNRCLKSMRLPFQIDEKGDVF